MKDHFGFHLNNGPTTLMQYNVFVSHNQLAKPWVRRFVDALRQVKLTVFFDEDSIEPGTRIVNAIDDALEASAVIVLIITPAAMESEWVSMESAIAVHLDPKATARKLIPVILEPVERKKLPPSIRSITSVSLYDPAKRERELLRLFRSLGVSSELASSVGKSESFWQDVPEKNSESATLPEDSLYIRKRTRDLIIDYFPQKLCDLESIWPSPHLSFQDIITRAQLFFPGQWREIKDTLQEARSRAYDDKYAEADAAQDARSLDPTGWEAELYQILRYLGMDQASRLDFLNVGISNGSEWTDFFESARRIVGVDVSPASLKIASKRHPKIETVQSDAADLSEIESDSFDVYLSLRTYQSTLFDITKSVLEAARVLRPNGLFVVSLSDAHRVGNEVVRGILSSDSRQVDRDHPYILAEKIRRSLTSLGFTHLGIRTGQFEVYVYGRRILPLYY